MSTVNRYDFLHSDSSEWQRKRSKTLYRVSFIICSHQGANILWDHFLKLRSKDVARTQGHQARGVFRVCCFFRSFRPMSARAGGEICIHCALFPLRIKNNIIRPAAPRVESVREREWIEKWARLIALCATRSWFIGTMRYFKSYPEADATIYQAAATIKCQNALVWQIRKLRRCEQIYFSRRNVLWIYLLLDWAPLRVWFIFFGDCGALLHSTAFFWDAKLCYVNKVAPKSAVKVRLSYTKNIFGWGLSFDLVLCVSEYSNT
jgi:hypothetical protein